MALFPIEKTMGPYFYGCNQLAALSTQQHFGLCMLTFLLSTRSSTSFNNSMNYKGVLYIEPVLWWHACWKTNGGGTVPIQPQEEKRNIRLAINYVTQSSRFGVRGNKRCLLVRFVSWLWADFFTKIYCSTADTLEAHWDQQPPDPLLSKSWMISK